jgi:hypothetical protein
MYVGLMLYVLLDPHELNLTLVTTLEGCPASPGCGSMSRILVLSLHQLSTMCLTHSALTSCPLPHLFHISHSTVSEVYYEEGGEMVGDTEKAHLNSL